MMFHVCELHFSYNTEITRCRGYEWLWLVSCGVSRGGDGGGEQRQWVRGYAAKEVTFGVGAHAAMLRRKPCIACVVGIATAASPLPWVIFCYASFSHVSSALVSHVFLSVS